MPNPTEYPRCRSCRWWAELRQHHAESKGYRYCDCPEITDTSTDIGCPSRGAIYEDCEGYEAKFLTHADFGCILHQPKETT